MSGVLDAASADRRGDGRGFVIYRQDGPFGGAGLDRRRRCGIQALPEESIDWSTALSRCDLLSSRISGAVSMADLPCLSLILPAYNEVGRIRHTIEKTQAYLSQRRIPYEIIVAADGDDGTREA